ncbi:MAG: prepilin-type N-terminal cleavage/methylation domain-containing protein [Acidobacteriota bacterium]|nr:prepilin-type N-terminal cleavage/methylation domain-containing protein [Acidobacteriota bacterium]
MVINPCSTSSNQSDPRDSDDDDGFTLIELLIVVVILGILAAIVVFAVQNLSGQSAQSACQSDVRTVESAAELYRAQTGAYPGAQLNPGANPSVSGKTVTGKGGLDAGDQALMGTVAFPNTTYGPWLKEAPLNANHYAVVISDDGKGTISVYTPDGSAQIPPANATNSAADCSAVS